MKCYNHSEVDAVAICKMCGKGICSDCLVTIASVSYCKACVEAGRISAHTFIENLTRELANSKWGEIKANIEEEGTRFDLFATRKSMNFWRAYITTSLQFIDQQTFQKYANIHEAFKEKARSWTWGDFTILCVIAEKGVSSDITRKVNKYSIGFFQTKGGGCLLCIVDLPERAAYMRIPKLPVPVHTISKEFKDMIDHTLAKCAGSS